MTKEEFDQIAHRLQEEADFGRGHYLKLVKESGDKFNEGESYGFMEAMEYAIEIIEEYVEEKENDKAGT